MLYTILLAIFFLLDIKFTIDAFYFFYYDIQIYLLIHLLLYFIYILVSNLLNEDTTFFNYFALCIPIFGFFMTILNKLFTKYPIQNDIIDDYEKYLKYINNRNQLEKVNVFEEINIMSLVNSLNVKNEDDRKQEFIKFITDNTDIKVSILKKSINSDDKEIAHYASTILSFLSENFENLIENARKKYHIDNKIEVINDIIDYYNKYLESEIIEKEVIQNYYYEYLKFLDLVLADERIKKKEHILFNKARILFKLNRCKEAYRLINKLLEKNETIEYYMLKLQILFNSKKWRKIKKIAHYIFNTPKLKDNIPEEYKEIIKFWITWK
ncbi:hypothetical protein EV215_0806 [Hypnocyclicus thermotrophus]|uniref:Uncharacterized protein n=1 Tax=Hypnocyclicus thermotrophus TaxID=1627895 RepID=A0AA46DZL9_9FUSO|nr:hypothetical protein [Hypnocyclicus thermotrophus]TDT71432.1 hypothetical protein EV215_0806 [Hypnocyclicus thermotrophus]